MSLKQFVRRSSDRETLAIIGTGDLSRRVATLVVMRGLPVRVVILGRDGATARRFANLLRFSALHAGLGPNVHGEAINLEDADAAAEVLSRLNSTIVFMGASLQSWRRITELPPAVFEKLDQAQLGPWLPMHLTLNLQLMTAISETTLDPIVVNAAYPDSVGPVLRSRGLAPAVGIGNVANIVPALRYGAAAILGRGIDDIEVRLVAHHFFSHYVPRFGEGAAIPHAMEVRDSKGEALAIDETELFGLLKGPLQRLGGVDGQLLTAASAFSVLRALTGVQHESVHAPSPAGLPGGYPVKMSRAGIELDLPDAVDLDAAVDVNEAGQRLDGIARISEDGTVYFDDERMAVMSDLLGYRCPVMRLEDTGEWAEELGAKYRQFCASVMA